MDQPASAQQQLDAAKLRRQWDEDDLLLNLIGPEELNERGYINLQNTQTDESFGYDPSRLLPAARWRKRNGSLMSMIFRNESTLEASDRIHPVFHQSRWDKHELIDQHFDSLQPILQLATLLLEDESISGYMHAMIDLQRHTTITLVDGVTKRKNFIPKPKFNETDHQEIWRIIHTLPKTHRWQLGTSNWRKDMDCFATTATMLRRGVFFGTLTRLDPEYFQVLNGSKPSSQFSVPWYPGTDDASALLRVTLLCAIILVHELMHALWKTVNKAVIVADEPFYRDSRVAEVGSQWEREVFGARVLDNACVASSPYGLHLAHWPGTESQVDDQRRSFASWGRGNPWDTQWAVDMAFVRSVFTHAFWEKRDRFGPGVFRPRRLLGARRRLTAEDLEVESDELGVPPMVFESSDDSESSHASSEDEAGTGIVDRFAIPYAAPRRVSKRERFAEAARDLEDMYDGVD